MAAKKGNKGKPTATNDAKDRDRRPDSEVARWLSQIKKSKEREDDYRKDGKRIREIYCGEKSDSTPFNVLFSNTETMQPTLYSATPRPVVERRYKDEDPLGKAAGAAGQRILEFLIDTNIEGYETFDSAMSGATLDGLLPGRGMVAFKYEADVQDVPGEGYGAGSSPQSETPTVADDSTPTSDSAPAEPPAPIPVKTGELVCPDLKSWNRVHQGFARKWSKVPWIAYEEQMDKVACRELFGASIASKISYTGTEEDDDEKKRKNRDDDEEPEHRTATVYQIWDKRGGRKIRYVSPGYTDGYLLVEDDQLAITGFFNTPEPLQFIAKTDDLVPVSLYIIYERQAEELNQLTLRINRLTKAIKAKGIYDSALGDDIAKLIESDETDLVPSDKGSSLAAEKGMDNAIWMMPVEKLIVVLRELYVAREACKQVIYEILGISDILRGASKASETLGAQQIKNQWGTLRLKPKQGEVQRYARDSLRMMLEIAAQKFSEDTWKKMTGLPYLTTMEAEQQQQIAQAMLKDPQRQQEGKQMLAQLQSQPTWGAILKVLQDDVQRAYRIDIETNSTLEPAAAEDKEEFSQMMTALAQFMQPLAPLVEKGVLPFEALQGMLLAICKRFRFGSEIEGYIREMKPPQQDTSEQDALKKENEALKGQIQQTEGGVQQAQKQQVSDKAQIAQLNDALGKEKASRELDARDADLKLREQKLAADEALFAIEQKAANDKMARDVKGETEKIGHQRQLVGMEKQNAKTEQVVAKSVDNKTAQSVGGLVDAVTKMMEGVMAQAEATTELAQAIKAPRKRTPKRDKMGDIEHVIDEPMETMQ